MQPIRSALPGLLMGATRCLGMANLLPKNTVGRQFLSTIYPRVPSFDTVMHRNMFRHTYTAQPSTDFLRGYATRDLGEKKICYRRTFEAAVASKVKDFDFVNSAPLFERVLLASDCLLSSPNTLAEYLLFLFTDEEIQQNREIFDRLICLCGNACTKSSRKYFEKVKMYLDNLKCESSTATTKPEFEKDGALWWCIGKEASKEGVSWVFKLRWEYDEAFVRPKGAPRLQAIYKTLEKIREIYPALEPRAHRLEKLFYKPILIKMGYKLHMGPSGIYITLPDRETLLTRWQRIKKTPEYAHLPDLSIYSSQGIASDSEYIKAFLEYDVLLSTGEENVHDHTYHVMKRLFFMSNSLDYLKYREKSRTFIKFVSDAIAREEQADHSMEDKVMFKILWFSVSALADFIAISETPGNVDSLLEGWSTHGEGIRIMWEMPEWKEKLPGLLKEWGATGLYLDGFDPDRIRDCWNRIIIQHD